MLRLGLMGSPLSPGAGDGLAEAETALGPGPASGCSHGARELCGSPSSGRGEHGKAELGPG